MGGIFEMRTCRHYAIAVLLSALLLSGIGLCADASPKDDAYHYMRNGVDDRIYNEWWYFNGLCNDSRFMILYLISDPENLTGSRKLQSWATVLEDGKSPAIGVRQSRGFGGDLNSPTFDLDQSGFSPLDSSGIKIWGNVPERGTASSIKWELNYLPTTSPWFGIPVQSHIGHVKGDWMKWLVYMPSAVVTGSIVVDNKTLSIDGVGYHDHCWGRWALNDPRSVWLETSTPQEGFGLALADITGETKNTFLGIKYANKTIKFSGKQIKLNLSDFAFDNATSRIYPAKYEVVAENGEYRLDLMAKVAQSVPLLLDYPLPSPSLLIFSQVADLQGVLKQKDGGEYQFNAPGFAGFSSSRLHPIFGKVNLTKINQADGGNVGEDAEVADTDIADTNIAATNLRTGQEKTAEATADGRFCLDADYEDYLADMNAPWIANGDLVKLVVLKGGRTISETNLTINLALDKQEAQFPEE